MSLKPKFKHSTILAGVCIFLAVLCLFKWDDVVTGAIFASGAIISSIFAVCNYIACATDDIVKKIKP